VEQGKVVSRCEGIGEGADATLLSGMNLCACVSEEREHGEGACYSAVRCTIVGILHAHAVSATRVHAEILNRIGKQEHVRARSVACIC